MRHLRLISLATLLIFPVLGAAQSQGLYLSAFLDRQSFDISDSRFTPVVGTVALGYWGWEGIGFELELGRGLKDSSVGDLDLEVSSMAALNLRLESPPIDRIAAYVQLGMVRTSFDTRFSGTAGSGLESNFTGPRFAIGLTFLATPNLHVDAGFSRHEYDDDIGINSFRVGIRFTPGGSLRNFRR